MITGIFPTLSDYPLVLMIRRRFLESGVDGVIDTTYKFMLVESVRAV